jgi:hypothetical protein
MFNARKQNTDTLEGIPFSIDGTVDILCIYNLKDCGRKQMKDLNVSQHLLRLSMPE